MLSLSKSERLKETKHEIDSVNWLNHLDIVTAWLTTWYDAVTTCGGGSRDPSPSLFGKAMLSLAAREVWTRCCRYGNVAEVNKAETDFITQNRATQHCNVNL